MPLTESAGDGRMAVVRRRDALAHIFSAAIRDASARGGGVFHSSVKFARNKLTAV